MRTAKQLAHEIERLWEHADSEQRDLTETERDHLIDLTQPAKSQLGVENAVKELSQQMGAPIGHGSPVQGGPGDVFIQSEGWKRIADPGHRPQNWTTGVVEVPPFQFMARAYRGAGYQVKGTLLEDTTGSGAGLIPVPQVIPGIQTTLFEPLGISNCFAQGRRIPTVSGTRSNGPPRRMRAASPKPARSPSRRSVSPPRTSRSRRSPPRSSCPTSSSPTSGPPRASWMAGSRFSFRWRRSGSCFRAPARTSSSG